MLPLELKAVVDDTQTDEGGCVPVKLFIETGGGHIGTLGRSFLDTKEGERWGVRGHEAGWAGPWGSVHEARCSEWQRL